eukprot:702370_1
MGVATISFLCALPSVLVFVPVSVYGNYKLHQHRNETFMKKRSLRIVYGLNIAFIAMMISYPLVPIIFFNAPHSLSSLAFLLVFLTWWVLLLLLNVRNWLIYFKSHWTYYTVQLQWQKIINPNITNSKYHWFIDNHKKYGNVSNILKRFVLFHLIGFFISMTGAFFRFNTYTASGNSSIISLLGIPLIIISLLIPIVFYSIILYKSPTFASSHVYIHWESEIQSKLLVLAIATFLFGMIIAEVFGFAVGSSLLSLSMSFIFFFMNYVSTFSLIRKNMTPLPPTNKLDGDFVIRLDDILSNKRAVHLFMVYLTTEFSIECLLSFIEIAQFEKYILESMEDEEALTLRSPPIIEHVIMHSNIPESLILQNKLSVQPRDSAKPSDKQLFDAKIRAHQMYNKYIRIGSEFEINISSLMRKRLMDLLDDKQRLMDSSITLANLAVIFEQSKYEMKRLLTYSYSRFRLRDEFDEVVALFAHKKKDHKSDKNNMDKVVIVYEPENETHLVANKDNESKDGMVEMGDGGDQMETILEELDHDDDDGHQTSLQLKDSASKSITAQLQLAIAKSNTPKGYVSMD